MNFFEAQAQAKRHTARLILLFALAVVGLVVLSNLLVFAVMIFAGGSDLSPGALGQHFDPAIVATVTLLVLITIGLGSVFKILALGGDGRRVAEMLGGRPVATASRDFAERQLINVVEEMAIASGIAVPPVYILEEPGINAFAAGNSPNTAVIGVTRGALEQLDRDQLQGVIAHEFSHVFNGDMRLNLRLLGVLHGILLLALLGWRLLRSMRYARTGRGRGNTSAAAMVPLFGLGLIAVGSIGYFFGQWIKATISRQRELLADASAVQYTRNSDGLAGALKKIGAAGSGLRAPAAAQYSYACFATAVGGWLQSMFATHPPLEVRIRRLDPQWDGRYVSAASESAAAVVAEARVDTAEDVAAVPVESVFTAVAAADALLARAGTADGDAIGLARELLAAIPPRLHAAAEEPYGARAVIYAMLLDDRQEVATAQERILATMADPAIALHARALKAEVAVAGERLRLPLAGIAMPALEALSPGQYQRFRGVVEALILADQHTDFGEWILRRYVLRRLDEAFGLRSPAMERYIDTEMLGDAASMVLSVLARLEHSGADEAAQAAFRAGAEVLEDGRLSLRYRAGPLEPRMLDAAFDRLESVDGAQKEAALKACVVCILHDRCLTTRGYELLRTLAACLDCPLPPLGRVQQAR